MVQEYLKEIHENYKNFQSFFDIVIKLKDVPRQGWIDKLQINNVESVADHSYSVTIIAMILSDFYKMNTIKIMKMALLHDLAESITGDLTPEKITKNEKKKLENTTMKEILSYLPENYSEIWEEFQSNSTAEAKFVHDIDKLEMVLQAKHYLQKGLSEKKISPFINTAKTQIKNKHVKKILNMLTSNL